MAWRFWLLQPQEFVNTDISQHPRGVQYENDKSFACKLTLIHLVCIFTEGI